MPLIDPEIGSALQTVFAARPTRETPPVGDWQTRRATINALYGTLTGHIVAGGPVSVAQVEAVADDGAAIPMRLYTPQDVADRGGLVVYLHGGGMFCCSLDTHHNLVKRYANDSRTKFLAVDFRFAPEFPFPYAVEDSYTALVWAADHAEFLGIDRTRIAVAGDSAGGGMAAAVALMARDRKGPALALQALIYPMLDDKNTMPDPDIAPYVTWSWDDNATGWGALLNEHAGTDNVSPYAAPAREREFSDLAPAYIEVGTLDIFRDESLNYAARLVSAGVPVELHMHTGAPHAFEVLAPAAAVSQRALADRIRVFSALTT